MKTYWRILSFARPISKYAIPYFFYTLFYAAFNAAIFFMIGPLLNTLFTQKEAVELVTQKPAFELSAEYVSSIINYALYKNFGANYDLINVLIYICVIIIVVCFLSNLFRYLGQRTVEYMRIHTLQKIRNEVYDNVLNLHSGFFSNERKGDIMSRITSDVQVVQFCITNTLQVVVREPLLIACYIFVMFTYSWKLTVFALCFMPIAAGIIGFIVKRLRKSAKEAQESFGEMTSLMDESLTGVKVIKSYNATGFISNKFHAINATYSKIQRYMANRQQLASPASEFLGISSAGVLLVFGGSLVLSGDLTGGAFFTILGVFTQLTRPVRAFADAFANINQGIAAGARVLTLLDTKSEIVEKENPVILTEFRDNIEFRGVRFSYESREILKGINFTINKGETVALVGPSGGGKSTISDLIPRFYDVQGGQILIDGTDIRDLSIGSLREQVGTVSQETILFNDTIENNIRLGNSEATLDDVIAAAKVANAHEFIMETDHGYQTNIGDRGMKLSGGQRQRLSIARAVLKNPSILILDEATSALDTESEKLVQQALDTLLVGRTSLVIAHRLSTISNADKIIVVDRGEIAEIGTHFELMKKRGVYCKLIEMQQSPDEK